MSSFELRNRLSDKFNLFILLYIAIFALIPIVTRNVIPFDMVENLYWGKEWQLGYAKHPPLFAWVSQAFFKLCFSIPESLYVLTQLNLLLGLYFIFKITQLIYEDEKKSYAAVFIFMCSVAAVFGNEKFNATTILMSLLPAIFYYFLRMLKFGRIKDAVLLGIFAALAFVGKYIALLFLGCMGIFLLAQKDCRKIFKTSLPYIAVAVFLIGISWHLWWMYESDFITLRYALEKSALAEKSPIFALHFLVMMILFFATSFLAACFAFSPSSKNFVDHLKFVNFSHPIGATYSKEEQFIIMITLAPSVILFLLALCTGMRIGSFWGVCMMMTLGTYLVVLNKKFIDIDALFKFTKYIAGFFAIVLLLKSSIAREMLKNSHPEYIINYREASRLIEQDYNRLFPAEKIKNIIADKITTPLHLYLKDSPTFYNSENYQGQRLFVENGSRVPNQIVTFVYKNNDGTLEKFHKIYNDDIIFEKDSNIYGEWILHYAFLKNR